MIADKIFLILTVFSVIQESFGTVYTSRSIQEKQEKYEKYIDCVQKRKATYEKWGNARLFKALIYPRYANIKLDCFQW